MDRYTKAVLTVIAAALVTLALEQASSTANALSNCGGLQNPCGVYLMYWDESGTGYWKRCIDEGRKNC